MRQAFATSILILGLISVTIAQFYMYQNVPITSAPLNPVNPNFTYLEYALVKTRDAGIPFVGQFYTGYISVNQSSQSRIFYSLYAKGGQIDPNATVNQSAPLILWLQGGPGCPDLQYDSFGPFNALNNSDGFPVPVANGLTWTENYHLLFVDSPIGVGYSVSAGDNPTSAWAAGIHLQNFLIRFFEIFPGLQQDFYIFGESYAGHYIPALTTILIQNFNTTNITVKGVAIGNGGYDQVIQPQGYPMYGLSTGLLDPILYQQAQTIQQQAAANATAGNLTQSSSLLAKLRSLIGSSGTGNALWNMDNYRNFTSAQLDDYSIWLNLDSTIAALNGDPDVNWGGCSGLVYSLMSADEATSYISNISFILSQDTMDINFLFYQGQDAVICNAPGVEMVVDSLQWSGLANYSSAPKLIWPDPSGYIIGSIQHYDKLVLANIYKAGHRAVVDQPWSAFDLINRFIAQNWTGLTPIQLNNEL